MLPRFICLTRLVCVFLLCADAAVTSTLIGEVNREKGSKTSVIKAMEVEGINVVGPARDETIADARVTDDSGADRGVAKAAMVGACCLVS